MNYILGFSYITISYIMVWFQLFGYLKIPWFKDNMYWFMYIVSLPIAYFITYGTKFLLVEFNESTWSIRFISFSINIFIFSLLSYYVNQEIITLKTTICLLLASLIVLIQLFWK